MDTYGNKQNNTKNHNLVKRVSQVVNAEKAAGKQVLCIYWVCIQIEFNIFYAWFKYLILLTFTVDVKLEV